MSFHFQKLHLKDWLVYGGTNELTFPDFQNGRNLIVLNGQNGYGKTSLLRALEFVFHGRGNRAELLELWHDRARNTREGSLEVGLEFTHSDRVCKIIRGADFKPWGSTVATAPWEKLFIDGQEVMAQVADKIEEMLPRECLEFVFFDGAEISRYAQKQHDAGVRDAVEKVLGIPSARNLRDDLAALVRSLEEEQERLLVSASNADDLLTAIEALKDDEESYTARRKSLLERRQALDGTRRELEAEAEGIDAIEKERHELEDKLRRIADLQERQQDLDGQIGQLVSRAPLAILVPSLERIVEELRARSSSSPRQERQHDLLGVLKKLVDEDVCVCGRALDKQARDTIRAELSRLEEILAAKPPPSGAQTADLMELGALLKAVKLRGDDAEVLVDKRAAIVTQIEELETDVARLRGQLQGHELVTVKELYEQIGLVTHQITEVDANVDSVDENLSRTRRDLEQKQRELDKIGAGNEQARGVTRTLEETRKLHIALADLVDQLTEKKRLDIEEQASEVFRMITNKPLEYAQVRVRPDYSLEVLRKDGSVVASDKLSAGEKEVVAYSFITALNLSSVDPSPFVMDTPFGHLDSGHRKGLLQSLPRLRVQAMLLATDRDLPPEERDAIDKAIAREFILKRDQQQALTTIEEA